MNDEIRKAWEKAQAAWKAAGATIPCHDESYMAARKELADAWAKAGAAAAAARNGQVTKPDSEE
jgi:hypothetical protein